MNANAHPNWEVELWRVIARSDDLNDTITQVLDVLALNVPVRGIVVRRLDVESGRVVTAASATLDDIELPHGLTERRQLDSLATRSVMSWASTVRPEHSSHLPSELAAALGTEKVPFIAAPIIQQGAAVWYATFTATVDDLSPALIDQLERTRAPFQAAVENERRIHELGQLRKALEADRSALLSRLERQDISELVIGEGGGLKGVSEQLDQVAPTDVPVLILGETGSGKEVIARTIHARSQRARGPVVRVNCGAIPSELIDSELFGHERGAFTGAVNMRKGWFERADGGTLFLDEIGELQPAAQVRLLRVLQEGTFERVGGHQTISVDVRIVAATHRRLENMVTAGSFREDLWYRLSVFPIMLPPLRSRPQDIPELARHFARNAGKRLGLSTTELKLSAEELAPLLRYEWPGNVRELAAVIERAAILGRGKRLDIQAALGATVSPRNGAGGSDRPKPAPTSSDPEPFRTLDAAMGLHIEQALVLSRGQIEGKGGAAELLDINPHTLRARMKKLGIDWNRYRALADVGRIQRA